MKTVRDVFKVALDLKKYNAVRGGLIEMAYDLPDISSSRGMIAQLIGIAREDKLEQLVFGTDRTSSYEWVKEWQALYILTEMDVHENQQ